MGMVREMTHSHFSLQKWGQGRKKLRQLPHLKMGTMRNITSSALTLQKGHRWGIIPSVSSLTKGGNSCR